MLCLEASGAVVRPGSWKRGADDAVSLPGAVVAITWGLACAGPPADRMACAVLAQRLEVMFLAPTLYWLAGCFLLWHLEPLWEKGHTSAIADGGVGMLLAYELHLPADRAGGVSGVAGSRTVWVSLRSHEELRANPRKE